LLNENQQDIIDVIEKDLHKHKIEIISGEIAPVVGEIEYMLAVSRYRLKWIAALDSCICRTWIH
jgi:hypothetical protein